MKQYRLQIAHQTSELTLIIVENITITSTPADKIFYCSVSINIEAIIIKDSMGARAVNTSGNRLDVEKLLANVEQLKDYI